MIFFDLISVNIIHLKSSVLSSFLIRTYPQPKYAIKLSNKTLSLLCWVSLNSRLTLEFNLELDDHIPTEKDPSPDVKPAIHSGCGTTEFTTKGLGTALTSGKQPSIRNYYLDLDLL